MLVEIHPQLHKAAINVLANKRPCVFEVKCTLTNGDSGASVDVIMIDSFSIVQDFINNYYDDMSIAVQLRPEEVVTVLSNHQNLKCSITMYRYDRNLYYIILDEEPIEIEAKVLIENNADIAKKLEEATLMANENAGNPNNDAYQSRRIPLQLQLIEEKAYELRQYKLNFMMKEATILDAIYYIAQKMGIEECSVVPIDNEEPIPELIVPPVYGIENIFPYLQEQYGIYSKGMEYYFTHGVLYIYPGFDPEPKSSISTCHVYSVVENTYIGSDGYHALKGVDVEVLCNTAIEVQELVEAGIENTGNAILTQHSENILDKRSKTDNEKTELIPNTISYEAESGQGKGMTPDARNIRYEGASANPFQKASRMASFGGGILQCGWINAEPWVCTPGQKLIFHYEKQENYMTHNGMITKLEFSFAATEEPAGPLFSAQAGISARLNPDNKE